MDLKIDKVVNLFTLPLTEYRSLVKERDKLLKENRELKSALIIIDLEDKSNDFVMGNM